MKSVYQFRDCKIDQDVDHITWPSGDVCHVSITFGSSMREAIAFKWIIWFANYIQNTIQACSYKAHAFVSNFEIKLQICSIKPLHNTEITYENIVMTIANGTIWYFMKVIRYSSYIKADPWQWPSIHWYISVSNITNSTSNAKTEYKLLVWLIHKLLNQSC